MFTPRGSEVRILYVPPPRSPSPLPPHRGCSALPNLAVATSIIARAYAAFVVGFVAWAAWAALHDYSRVPTTDDSRILIGMLDMPFWQWVFSVQNGHRVPATLLLYAADYHWLEGRNTLPVVASIVTLGLATAAVGWAVRADRRSPPVLQLALAAVVFLLFWVASCFNLLRAVSHANAMVVLCGVIALGLLARHARQRAAGDPRATRSLAAVVGAGLATTASMGQGVAIWPALVLLALAMRLPLRSVAVLVAAGVLVGGGAAASIADFTGDLGHPPPAEVVLFHPHRLLRFVATQVGGIVGTLARELGVDSGSIGQGNGVAGVAGLVLLAGHVSWIHRHPRQAGPCDWLAVGMMTFAAGVAAGVGATRLFSYGFEVSYALRFLDWSGLFWAGALLAGAAFGMRSARPVAWFAASAAVVVFSSAGLLLAMDDIRDGSLRAMARAADASLAILVGAAGGWEFHKFYRGDVEHLDPLLERLRRDRKSLYADPRWDWIGERLEHVLAVDADHPCDGAVDEALPDEMGRRSEWRIQGWAWDDEAGDAPESIALVDRRGRIRGLANAMPRYAWRQDEQADWEGWVRFSRERNTYTAYGVLGGGRACLVADERRGANR